ncbi:MAG: DNA topoisomerase IV subunit A [Acidobacteria bacterium]|nr:MAG: DNA topoisomerase IV subunit A [Acidobacteriota bacterium]
MSYVEPLMRRNFLEYASYVIVDRAIPDLRDGLKPVQRRILTTLFEMDDGRFHKVANVIGETMKLHPHGDASIGDALVVLANKDYFIERQGNFGNVLTGHPPAAARYIECRLTALARETLFNKKLTEYQPSYDGRKQEPVFLPAKLPVILLLGTEGIAVGMATRILPHNFCELLRAQIALLRKEPIELYPDFQQGGLLDVSDYDDGRGRVRVRARIERRKDKKTLIIREIPYGTTTESLINSIETAVQKGKLKVASIEDRTAEDVEIVLHLPRGVYADEVEPQLYAYTQCEASISSNITVIRGDHPAEMTVTEVMEVLTRRLRDQIKAELELELRELEDRRHFMTLEQIFIENRVYKGIETERTSDGVRRAVWDGMDRYRMFFIRPMTDDDVDRLLKIPIRRISVYDINKYKKDLDEVVRRIKETKRKLRALTRTTIAYLEDLLERYGGDYKRRTEIQSFDVVSKKEVALQALKVSYDPKTGFVGTAVKGSKFKLSVSEYDKLLIVSGEGFYKVVSPPEKLYVGPKVLAVEELDEEAGVILTFLYRDAKKMAWAKKIHITGFIRDKEYDLIKGRQGTIDKLWVGDADRLVQLLYRPAPRQRKKEDWFDPRRLEVCGLAARGTRMGSKPVARIKLHKPS